MYIPPKIEQIISEFDFSPWINRPLTKEDTNLLCEELNLPSFYSDTYCKWPTLQQFLYELDFKIIYTKRIINGRQKRVYILKKEQP